MQALQPGIHLLHKPRGPTSFSILQPFLSEARDRPKRLPLCHGGALDPFAHGLVLLLAGRATRLFAANCSVCHGPLTGTSSTDNAASNSAPSLMNFGSREWLTGLLDAEKIKSARYFGNTRHAKGEMAGFIVDNLKELDEADKARLKSVIAALSAEAALPSQADADKAAEADGLLAKGRKALGEAFESSSCTDCHKFRDQGDLGSAPDLTGWASKDWLVRFINDPTHEAFYRDTNDRMPSFGKSSGGPTNQALLSATDIELIARLIRGELK